MKLWSARKIFLGILRFLRELADTRLCDRRNLIPEWILARKHFE